MVRDSMCLGLDGPLGLRRKRFRKVLVMMQTIELVVVMLNPLGLVALMGILTWLVTLGTDL